MRFKWFRSEEIGSVKKIMDSMRDVLNLTVCCKRHLFWLPWLFVIDPLTFWKVNAYRNTGVTYNTVEKFEYTHLIITIFQREPFLGSKRPPWPPLSNVFMNDFVVFHDRVETPVSHRPPGVSLCVWCVFWGFSVAQASQSECHLFPAINHRPRNPLTPYNVSICSNTY